MILCLLGKCSATELYLYTRHELWILFFVYFVRANTFEIVVIMA